MGELLTLGVGIRRSARPRPALAHRRLRRHARRRGRDHGAAVADSAPCRTAAGGIRRRRPLRDRRRHPDRVGDRAGRPRDDGRARDPRRGGIRALRLPARRRRAAALRDRRARTRRRRRARTGPAQHFEQCGATSVRVAADADERRRMWSGRKSAFPAVGRLAPDYYCMDGTIPRRHLAAVLARITDDVARVRPGGGERVPRRRWQPASVDPVRCGSRG